MRLLSLAVRFTAGLARGVRDGALTAGRLALIPVATGIVVVHVCSQPVKALLEMVKSADDALAEVLGLSKQTTHSASKGATGYMILTLNGPEGDFERLLETLRGYCRYAELSDSTAIDVEVFLHDRLGYDHFGYLSREYEQEIRHLQERLHDSESSNNLLRHYLQQYTEAEKNQPEQREPQGTPRNAECNSVVVDMEARCAAADEIFAPMHARMGLLGGDSPDIQQSPEDGRMHGGNMIDNGLYTYDNNFNSPCSSPESIHMESDGPEVYHTCSADHHEICSSGSLFHCALSTISEEGSHLGGTDGEYSDGKSVKIRSRATSSEECSPRSNDGPSQDLQSGPAPNAVQGDVIKDYMLPFSRIPYPPPFRVYDSSAAAILASVIQATDLWQSKIPRPPPVTAAASTAASMFPAMPSVVAPPRIPRPIKITVDGSLSDTGSSDCSSSWRPEPTLNSNDCQPSTSAACGEHDVVGVTNRGQNGKRDAYGQETQPWFNGSLAELRLGCTPFAKARPTS
ncbi:hypothetical protein WJX73_001320 [Symbiochloris irregularis]|uniref:Uncharacterized protein n=1 Tax=Symbiochloris irregularis TaxID=706552 RepID=A0AAW1NT88_9CHLO